MVTSDFVVAPTIPKVELRFATMQPGVQCVMTCGDLLMPWWPADSWDCPQMVQDVDRRCEHAYTHTYPNMHTHTDSNCILQYVHLLILVSTCPHRCNCCFVCSFWPGNRTYPSGQCGMQGFGVQTD